MTPFSNLSESQGDLLKEVGNIGSGNAATSLSMLIGDKIDMKIPTVRIVGYDEMMDLVGGPDALITAIFLRIEGDTPGNMFFVLSPEETVNFIEQMTGQEDFSVGQPPYDEMALSALEEAGNIFVGYYLLAIFYFLYLLFIKSLLSFTHDLYA